ncbi:MAG: DUF4402 domain-containing protein, partial [Alphaproteobacteria bacterium]|nr:DUF4402 domain-containing protein [Alphaproteobacteria bacterium]
TGLTDRGGCTLSVDTSGPVVITMATPTDTVADGPNDMDVNNFILQTSSAGPAATITISPTAQISLRVGGTLNITAGQAGGTYSGAVTINANYE